MAVSGSVLHREQKNVRLNFSAGFADFFTLQIGFFTQCCQVMSFLRFYFCIFFSV